ncbi:MAG: Gfo/Idh/MocA family oxidoreductase [Alphaproteobacteria bacterium]|nr:Gfo/Idh/MocA family oxidoreductase [Alphaproteobacteria bacterium]
MSAGSILRWSVIGVGVAGRARARAIAADPRAQLACVWRGKHAPETGARMATDLADAIASADVVAICSPTGVHADQARQVLRAGRHCLVEFPLATTASEAASLFALARERGLVLHVEHIELLEAAGRTLGSHVRPEIVASASVSFRGVGPEGASAPDLALANVARLHRLCAVTGPIASVVAVDHEPGRLTAELLTAHGSRATCLFEQAPYFQRRTLLEVRTAAGAAWKQSNDLLTRDGVPQTLLGVGELFPKDQRRVSARILDGTAPYVAEERVLHVLDLVAMLGARTTGTLPHRSDAGGTD